MPLERIKLDSLWITRLVYKVGSPKKIKNYVRPYCRVACAITQKFSKNWVAVKFDNAAQPLPTAFPPQLPPKMKVDAWLSENPFWYGSLNFPKWISLPSPRYTAAKYFTYFIYLRSIVVVKTRCDSRISHRIWSHLRCKKQFSYAVAKTKKTFTKCFLVLRSCKYNWSTRVWRLTIPVSEMTSPCKFEHTIYMQINYRDCELRWYDWYGQRGKTFNRSAFLLS